MVIEKPISYFFGGKLTFHIGVELTKLTALLVKYQDNGVFQVQRLALNRSHFRKKIENYIQ